MEAQNRVIDVAKLIFTCVVMKNHIRPDIREYIQKQLERQDEISFKAGRIEAFEEVLTIEQTNPLILMDWLKTKLKEKEMTDNKKILPFLELMADVTTAVGFNHINEYEAALFALDIAQEIVDLDTSSSKELEAAYFLGQESVKLPQPDNTKLILLGDDEIADILLPKPNEVLAGTDWYTRFKLVAKAQRVKDQSYYQPLLDLKDAEIKKLKQELSGANDEIEEKVAVLKADYEKELKEAEQKAREELIKEIEKSSTPTNTNMFGISLSRSEWQAIRGKK